MNNENIAKTAQVGSNLAGSVYDGSQKAGLADPLSDVISAADRKQIRELALKLKDLSALPVMAERKRQWTALHDLKMERPMILFETTSIQGYIDASELK